MWVRGGLAVACWTAKAMRFKPRSGQKFGSRIILINVHLYFTPGTTSQWIPEPVQAWDSPIIRKRWSSVHVHVSGCRYFGRKEKTQKKSNDRGQRRRPENTKARKKGEGKCIGQQRPGCVPTD